MNDSRRLGIVALALVLLWILTYWLTDRPAQDPFAIAAPPIEESVAPPPVIVRDPEPPVKPPPKVEPSKPEPAPQASKPGVIPPSFRMYTIERGDTPSRISEKVYGTSKHWRSVQQANPFVDFSKIKVGREIRIPVDPENIQGLPTDPTPEPETDQPEYTEYIVESGDTLSGIARSLYGKSGLWTIIRDANRDQINRDGTNLRSGMVLKIPPAPQEAR